MGGRNVAAAAGRVVLGDDLLVARNPGIRTVGPVSLFGPFLADKFDGLFSDLPRKF